MKAASPLILALAAMPLSALAQGDEPAHARACAACHGSDGVSVAANIPNLAAQPAAYLAAQLRAYRGGSRDNALMSALAASLSDEEIERLAAHYAGLAGAPDGSARSELLPELVRDDFPFPNDYETDFVRYRTAYPGDEVRHFYANRTALEAAREGNALPDGSYVLVEIFAAERDDDGELRLDGEGQRIAGERIGFNAMAREAGWGDSVPSLLRNENWLYASFSADGAVNSSTNQANCLACHVPVAEESYVFSFEPLREAARTRD